MARVDRIDWIEAFVAVHDWGSFSQAATHLHRSQSRVSVHVASLEKALGHTLFNRSRYPVTLTHAGREFLPRARAVLSELQSGTHALDSIDDVVRGHFVLGSLPSISAMFIPEVLRRMELFHPEVTIDIRERTTGELLKKLLDESIDVALRCSSDPHEPAVKAMIPLWTEPIVAVFPENHPLASTDESISPDDLSRFEIGTTGVPGRGIDPDMASRLDYWKLRAPRSSYHTEQPQTLLNMAKAGLMVPIINLLAYNSCEHTGLSFRVINGDQKARTVGLYWNPARPHSPAVKAFIRVVKAAPVPNGAIPISD